MKSQFFLTFIIFALVRGNICQLLNIIKSGLEPISGVVPNMNDLVSSDNPRLSEDGQLSFIGLSVKYGHPAEEINITTEDGYILTLYHIPGLPGDEPVPFLLVHGNTAASDCWLLRGNISMAITLAEQGRDVWLLNLRGSSESRKHVSIDPDTEAERFFNYSFYEQGIYDLPPTIDYILKETGQEQLVAMGHSVGTTVFYVLGAENPEYNDKIALFISYAPICFLQNLRGLVTLGLALGQVLVTLLLVLGTDEVLGERQVAASLLETTCLGPLGYEICVQGILFRLFGPDEEGFEREFVNTFFGHYPDGSSRKLFDHLVQVNKRDKFAKFDYGEEGNLKMYNSTEPPEFDLSKVTMKIALYVGKKDYLSAVDDVARLSQELPNVVHHQVLPYDSFNHFDFVWGKHMPETLYPYTFSVLEENGFPSNNV